MEDKREKKLKAFSRKEKNNIIDDAGKEKNKKDNRQQKVFDIAIIGAGCAGLSAALLLGRYIRPTVIFDNGNTRNSMTRQVHGYLGYENICPNDLIKKAWKDVTQYRSVKVINEEVKKVKKHKDFFINDSRKKNVCEM